MAISCCNVFLPLSIQKHSDTSPMDFQIECDNTNNSLLYDSYTSDGNHHILQVLQIVQLAKLGNQWTRKLCISQVPESK